ELGTLAATSQCQLQVVAEHRCPSLRPARCVAPHKYYIRSLFAKPATTNSSPDGSNPAARDALTPFQIVLGEHFREAAFEQQVAYVGALVEAVFEQQPAAAAQVLAR